MTDTAAEMMNETKKRPLGVTIIPVLNLAIHLCFPLMIAYVLDVPLTGSNVTGWVLVSLFVFVPHLAIAYAILRMSLKLWQRATKVKGRMLQFLVCSLWMQIIFISSICIPPTKGDTRAWALIGFAILWVSLNALYFSRKHVVAWLGVANTTDEDEDEA